SLAAAVAYVPCVLRFSLFFFSCSVPPPALPSFPTRRSSDLHLLRIALTRAYSVRVPRPRQSFSYRVLISQLALVVVTLALVTGRSEEHTSELQSRFELVCRLLLEKKKQSGPMTQHVAYERVA